MNKMLSEDLEPYIDERICHNMDNFKQAPKWKKAYNEFNKIYDDLFNSFDKIAKNKLENLLAQFNDLSSQEQYEVYKIGFVDGIRLRDDIQENRRK